MVGRITREIIHIDEEKCDGCGLCVPACAEGALQIIDGKARLIGERLCDGLGACLGDCPQGRSPLKCGKRGLDTQAVEEHLSSIQDAAAESECTDTVACTACSEMVFEKEGEARVEAGPAALSSELTHWPIQPGWFPGEISQNPTCW